MQTVIFAGGLGTRLSEETEIRPKPMVLIGGKPILWHIMKIYQSQGFNEFIICLGYKGYMIKEYFMNYYLHNADITIDLSNNQHTIHNNNSEDFKITLVETGPDTKTAGRLKRVREYIKGNSFMLTYGDGLADIDLKKLIAFHKEHKKTATLTSIMQNNRYGSLVMSPSGLIEGFREKPKDTWVNGGFFVLNKEIFSMLPEKSDDIMWEDAPMQLLTESEQLMAYKHEGFWKCMDALRDKIELEQMWNSGNPQWKSW